MLIHGDQPDESLSDAFSRLSILVISIKEYTLPGKFRIGSPTLTDCPPTFKFSTIADARVSLEPIINNAVKVLYAVPQINRQNAAPGPDATVANRIQVDAQIRHWLRSFDAFLTDALPQSPFKDSSTVEQLQTYSLILRTLAKYISLRLWVSYLSEDGPSLYALIPDFEEVLDLSNRCTISQIQGQPSVAGQKAQPPFFIMDMGVVPAMFFVACKGPSIRLRQKAIKMLERHPRREVMWCSTTAARIAESLLDMEMQNTTPNLSEANQRCVSEEVGQLSLLAALYKANPLHLVPLNANSSTPH